MEILKVFDLDKEADTLAGNLPYGKQRKLEIARALATNPKLLLLDEPAAGMNPNETQELMDTIRFVQKHFDMTILLIEHDMKLVGGICEEVTVLNFGQVLAQGETSKVLKDPAVITAYLGEDVYKRQVRYLVLIGQTRDKIKEAAERLGVCPCILCENLEEALKICVEKANPGDAVLLSPACASWGQFDNYEQRGDMFKMCIRDRYQEVPESKR